MMDWMLFVARYRYKGGAFKDALAWLVSVEKKCSEDGYFHYLWAQCHAALGDMDRAREALQKVAKMSEILRLRALDDPVFEAIYGADTLLDNP